MPSPIIGESLKPATVVGPPEASAATLVAPPPP